jgi:ABC-type multidrug transport system permease subunit
MNEKRKKLKNQKFENSYSDIVIFWFATLAYIFFVIFAFCKIGA